MNFVDLAIIYGVLGVGCAGCIVVVERQEGQVRLHSVLLAITIWPLWAPLALAKAPKQRSVIGGEEILSPTEALLEDAIQAGAGTAFSDLLPKPAVDRITTALRRAELRKQELESLLGQPEFDREHARQRLLAIGDSRNSASARLHLENIERLHTLKQKSIDTTDELHELLAALRTQLVLARFDTDVKGVDEIVDEVWNRVAGLNEALGSIDCVQLSSEKPHERVML